MLIAYNLPTCLNEYNSTKMHARNFHFSSHDYIKTKIILGDTNTRPQQIMFKFDMQTKTQYIIQKLVRD